MVDMDSRSNLIQLLCVFICVSTLADAERVPNELGQYLKGILFGDQWRLGQYCNVIHSPGEILARDQEIGALYDGSYLHSINTTTDWSAALDRLDRAQLLGAQSRQELSALCSINSWGYADKITEDLSNRPHENAFDCLAQLNEFYTFSRKLVSKTRGPFGADNNGCNTSDSSRLCQSMRGSSNHISLDAIEEDTTNFTLNHWLQFNSFGRLPSGKPYSSNLIVGDYDTCTKTLDSTRYCLGAYDKPSRSGAKNKGGLEIGGPKSVVWPYRVGLCLPKSCSARILTLSAKHMKMIDSIVKANLLETIDFRSQDGHAGQENLDHRYQLTDLYCPPVGDSVLIRNDSDLVGRLLRVHLPLAWLALLLIGTVYPLTKPLRGSSSIGNTFIYCNLLRPFDLCRNWKSFRESTDADFRLVGLNGAKVVAMNWLFLSHVSITLYPYLSDISKWTSDSSLHGAVILQGQHGVPLFFIISGLLVGYKYLLQGESVDFKTMLVSRYFRLAPMYLIVYAYVKKFGHLIGDGPLWDYGVSNQSEARQCMNESWLVPILMLANFTPPFTHCIITGWHIANDFQIFFILPLLLQAYKYSRRFGISLICTIFMLSHATHAWYWGTADSYNYQLLALQTNLFGPRIVLDRLVLDYVNPLGRIGSYFLGVLVADSLISKWTLESGACSSCGGGGAVDTKKNEKKVTFKSRRGDHKLSWGSGIFVLNKRAVANSLASKRLTTPIESNRKFNQNQVDSRHSSSGSQETCCEPLDNGGQSNLSTKSTPSSATRATSTPIGTTTADSNCFRKSNLSKNYDDDDDDDGLSVNGGKRRNSSGSSDGRNVAHSSFKANTMVLAGICLTCGAVFSVLLPDYIKLMFDSKLSKAIMYPLVRFCLEIGWALLLYCLLRSCGQQQSATASQRHTKTVRQTKVKRASRKTTKSRAGLGVITAGDDRGSDEDKDEEEDVNGQDLGSRAANCFFTSSKPEAATAILATAAIIEARLPPPPPSSAPSSSSSSPLPVVDKANSGFTFGFGGSLLKKPFWNVLVKLNYTLMLTHYTLVRYVVQSQRQLIAFSWSNYFQLTAFLLLAAYALSLLVHLTIEMPVTSLTKLLLSRVIARRRPVV